MWIFVSGHITACNETHYGYECSTPCTCVLNNTLDCNDTTGDCSCYFGWNGMNCDIDIDECESSNFCSDIHSSCFNLNGSAECRCDIGFENSTDYEGCQGK